MSNEYKKHTHEDKFDRNFWVNNKAKQNYFRFIKRRNNKKYRRYIKDTAKEVCYEC